MATEQPTTEELANKQNDAASEPNPPDQPSSEDKGEEASRGTEQTGPIHERCVHGEINVICTPLDKNDVYCCTNQPYDIPPLNEWYEAEQIFKSTIEFAEDLYSDWSPCPSPVSSSMSL